MAFLNFLGNSANPLEALMAGASPGFAGGAFGGQPAIEGMGGLEQSLAQNQALAQQRQQMQPPKQKLGIGEIIGLIGDAARGWKGQEPVYGPRMQERRKQQSRNAALSNYLDDPEGAIRALFAAGDPETALAVMKARQGGEPPAFVQEYQYRQGLPEDQRKEYDAYAQARKFNPYGAPLVLNPGDVFEGGGPQGAPEAPQTATNPETGEKVQFNPQSGQWEPVGGASASPAPTFPY